MPSRAADALDRLYAAPLERFVALRRELTAELRARGDARGSSEVAAAKKPSRTAWAINQLARLHPERLQATFDAHAAAARAQTHGEAEAMRKTARAFRDCVAEAVSAAASVLTESGARVSATQARQLAETVRAAAVGGPEARSRLMAGQLTEDIDVEDPFAGVAEGATGHREKQPPAAPTKQEQNRMAAAAQKEARERQARERVAEEARKRVESLEQQARDARAAARQAEVALVRAEAEADRARRNVQAIEERLLAARRPK